MGCWSLVLAAIGLGACAVGSVQLWTRGVVTVRPGHAYARGDGAAEMLVSLGLVGAALGIMGLLLLNRARRLSRALVKRPGTDPGNGHSR